MTQKKRDKEYWLIPKRANLHQSILLVKGIVELKYHLKTWNPSKQDRLGSYLGKNGATNTGKTITPQAVRTLLASIPQYLGYVYIDTSTTPNTMVVTNAGKKFVTDHVGDLQPMTTLIKGDSNNETIKESTFYRKQFEKLQLTNPIVLKDCENICIFPLLVIYKLVRELEYLDVDELAYIVFKIKDHSEIPLAKREILNLRKMDTPERVLLIELFKTTHLGNISLVQAPTSTYFIKLLMQTGVFVEEKIELPNPNNTHKIKTKSIKIKHDALEYVSNALLNVDFNNTYDFGNNVKLWIDYIGDPTNAFVPKDIEFLNDTSCSYILNIEYNDEIIFSDFVSEFSSKYIPMFKNKKYIINCIDLYSGKTMSTHTLLIDDSIYTRSKIAYKLSSTTTIKSSQTIENLADEILSHCESPHFDAPFIQYLTTLEKITGKSYVKNKSLRGGRLEYLFYKLLTLLKEKTVIDDVYWNGKISQYGLPTPAPGGKTGIPDLVFIINDTHILLELTTIKSKSLQWTAEGASVPDHINHYKIHNNVKTRGLYVAPIHHTRVTNGIRSQLIPEIDITYLNVKEFVRLLKKSDKNLLIDSLKIDNESECRKKTSS